MKKRLSAPTKRKNASLEQKKNARRSKPFPIVAIGASAGGIEAISELLKNLSPETGMAYVYIQHLDPNHPSMLSTILSKMTRMKVLEAKELMHIEPDHFYIIPPNKEMFIVDGVLTLNPRPARPAVSMPINRFFMSLADKQKEGSIGIVLSGNATDGALGLRAIKNAGGFTFAQDESAKFQSMPRAAVAEGGVDLVMPPKEISAKLEELKDHMPILTEIKDEKSESTILNNDSVNPIFQLLKNTTDVDFTHYKPSTIRRRIIRRMLLQKMKSMREYHKYLVQNKAELNMLHNDLLINVTSFFRDQDTLNYLRKKALPALLRSKRAGDTIRIWVPACSTGEEAYSLAMLVTETMDVKSNIPVQIFASDLSEAAITKARSGIYSRADVASVSEKQLDRFFTKTDGSFRIIKSIRDLCVFAHHNVFKDPPFSRIDIVSCCNLLIYLDEVLQKKLLTTLRYSLNPGGILILGKSESVNIVSGLFSQIEKKIKIFSRKKESNDRNLSEGSNMRIYDKSVPQRINASTIRSDKNHDGLDKMVDNILLDQFSPASIVVTKEMDILQFRGSTSLFLEPAPGKASLNLMKMARPGLGFELRNAVHKVNKSGHPVIKTGIEIHYKNSKHYVSIEVLPIRDQTDEQLYLVVFEELVQKVNRDDEKSSSAQHKKVKQLEEELMAAREDMRSIIEEHEVVNEELQSANEEVVSSNEELQSINEELETSKEEIESSNEELMTINSELQMRNEQLNEAYDYADSVLATLREAILILDKNLQVIRANQTFYTNFNVSAEETVGLYIYDLGNGQWDIPGLRKLLENIVPNNSFFNNYEVRHHFPSIGEKIMVLNARRITQKVSKEQLILLAIEDITASTHATQLLESEKNRILNIINSIPQMVLVSSPDGKPAYFNHSWYKYTGQTEQEALTAGTTGIIHPDELNKAVTIWDEFRWRGESIKIDFRYLRKSDHTYRWHFVHTSPVRDADGNIIFWITTFSDIHEQKMFADEMEKQVNQRTQALKEANISLQNSNKELQQFAYVASHDLQEPLRKITTFSDRLQHRFAPELAAQAVDYIDKISASAQRMSRLIEDLLNYSRIGNTSEPFVETDLNAVFAEVMKDFDLILKEKKGSVSAEKLPVIEAVPFQMVQLFRNLISNALKFSTDGRSPVLEIKSQTLRDISKWKELNRNQSYTEITFTDNGIGFNQNLAEQVFEIFQRLHSRDEYPGTGIGLALCKKIANYHRGIIYSNSKIGEGSIFHVILPLNQEKKNAAKYSER